MSSRIYVGHLPPDVTKEDLEDHFKKIAPLKDLMLKPEKGFAFVVSIENYKRFDGSVDRNDNPEYESIGDADQAISQLNDSDINGYKIMVKQAYARKEGGDKDRSFRDDRRKEDRFDDRRRDRGGEDRFDDNSRRREERYDDRRRPMGGEDRYERRDYGRDRDREYRRDRFDDNSRRREDRYDDPRRRGDDSDRSRFDKPRNTKWRLIIENLPVGVNWRDLKDFFRKAAEVTYADVRRDRDDEGVADFATEDDMKEAMRQLDGTELNGQKVYLREERMPERDSHRDRDVPMRSRERSASPKGY